MSGKQCSECKYLIEVKKSFKYNQGKCVSKFAPLYDRWIPLDFKGVICPYFEQKKKRDRRT